MSDSEKDKKNKWNISLHSIKRDISNNLIITAILAYLSFTLAKVVSYHAVKGLTVEEFISVFLVDLIPTSVQFSVLRQDSPFIFFISLFLFLIVSVGIIFY